MTPMHRGIAVAAIHCLIVLSLAGKYAVDRERLPRVWVKTTNFDPNLPIRGRYVRLVLEAEGPAQPGEVFWASVSLSVRDGRLFAVPTSSGTGVMANPPREGRGWLILEPVPFFIPEHIPDPSRTRPGEELWVEVSVPRHGPPRPIQLGIRKDGALTPLQLR